MKSSLVRFAVAIGLLVAFAVSFASASAQGVPSLTVHARYCDPGTVPDDPFTACHDNPLPGFNVGFDGVSNAAITDDDGNVSFTALDPRSYQIFVSAPLKATEPVVYCSVVGGDGSALTLGTASSGVTVPVASGQEVVCDWYWLISDGPSAGENAPFTIHVGLCPNDQIPADFFATCHGNPGANIEFFKGTTSLGSSDASGVLSATFSGSGTAQINGGVPGEFARNFIYCSSDADQSELVALTEVPAGTNASVPYSPSGTTCDWYVVPENLSGLTPTAVPTGGVSQLPNTGTGPSLTSTSGGPGSMVFALLGFAVLAMTGLCLRIRRQS